jgi:hypothetical protein
LVVGLGIALAARDAGGQAQSPPTYAEYRVDAIVGRGTAIQGGAGIVLPLGTYVRLGIDGAVGATRTEGETRMSGRADAIARFLLDPFREAPFGLSLGGGLSVPYVRSNTRVRPYLTAVMDIEGRTRGNFTPALQLGLGGGTRAGVIVRTSPPRWR